MPSFLQLVAQDLANRFGENISNVTLVFPSRRASLFFNSHLSKLIQQPIWTPKVLTINELMEQIAGTMVGDSIKLVATLFNVYKGLKNTDESFDNFYFWGEVMLADFDQIDKYLVDPKQLFTNIKDIKDIENQFGELSPEQAKALQDYLGVMNQQHFSELRNNYFGVWGILLQIYERFNLELEKANTAYEGMVYRKAASILSNPSSIPNLPKQLAFIGFNALNECEKALFKRSKTEENTLFYWDYDPIFVQNPGYEAGLFIRENLLKFPNALSKESFQDVDSENINVKIVAAPSTVAQTKLIPRILEEMKTQGAKLDVSTAIVLPKENILLPTLQAIPESVELLNITMGYPLRETPAFSLAELLVKLQINGRKSKDGEESFYHRDVLGLLNHPYIRICEPNEALRIVSEIKRRNRIYAKQTEVATTSLLESIFKIIENEESITKYITSICNQVSQVIAVKSKDEENQAFRIDLEFLFALFKSLKRVDGALNDFNFTVSSRVYLQLLRKVFAQERVSFTGEPLMGLQVMGFLETRALDFENIIILSFNDDVLPGRNHPVSFITPSLRVAFGLPDYKHHDAVYAYYFYRLLNRAKNVYLVYSNKAEGLSSGEVSRFGMQLQMEQMIDRVETISVDYNLSLTPPLPITINKDPNVMDKLIANLSKKGKGISLSPSGLTSYLTCPLRFYFRYVVGIDEEEEITEEVGALEFGKIIHNTMEELYKPYQGNNVSSEVVKSIRSNSKHIDDTLSRVFSEIFFNDNSTKPLSLSGRNLLAYNAMLYTINKMLMVDEDRAPFHLVSHELEVFKLVEIAGYQVRLGGFIDRVEIKDGTVWSIDYKTGKSSDSKGKFEIIDELFDPEKIDNKKEVFQTFCYALALTDIYPSSPIKPALWFVKTAKGTKDFNISQGKSKAYKSVDDFRVYQEEFKFGLTGLLSEIFDPNIPFMQTDDSDRCRNCPFNILCSRE